MKKTLVIAALVLMGAVCLVGCKEKRCKCISSRIGYPNAVALEPKGDHASCSELNGNWNASDSTGAIIMRECEEYED